MAKRVYKKVKDEVQHHQFHLQICFPSPADSPVVLAMKCILALAVLLGLTSQAIAQDQNPKVWDALDVLRGRAPLSIPEIQDLYTNAVAGQDYPLTVEIPPPTGVDPNVPGFYADQPTRCQGFHRVDLNGNVTSFLCPNQTLFNQITLICDWWYNIDCKNAPQFATYSNSRLVGDNLVLLDNQDVYEIKEATGAAAVSGGAQAAAPAAGRGAARGGAARGGAGRGRQGAGAQQSR